MTAMAQMNSEDDENDKELAMIRLYEQKSESLKAYHRRLEAEAREREAASVERAAPALLGIGAIWLVGTLWKHRRR